MSMLKWDPPVVDVWFRFYTLLDTLGAEAMITVLLLSLAKATSIIGDFDESSLETEKRKYEDELRRIEDRLSVVRDMVHGGK